MSNILGCWEEHLLGDGITLISGQHILADDYNEEPSGIPYLTGPADFSSGKIVVSKYTTIPKQICKAGDILVTVKGSGTGKLIRADREYCISRQLMAIRPHEWNTDFVFYYLELNSLRFAGAAAGLIPGISREDILKIPIPLPPLPEQRKIAQILSTWDEAIATVLQLIAALQRRKQGLMQRLLTGQVRFPEFVGTEWNERQLGDFLKYTPRKVEKPTVGYTRMGIRSHGKGTFTEFIDDPTSNEMDFLYTVKGDDLIVNITFAWEQAIAIVSPQDEGALVSHRFPTYEFDRTQVVQEFFRYLMLTKSFLYQLDLITPGGAGRNRVMSKTDFLKLRVLVPSVDEQKRIGAALTCIDESIKANRQYLDKLKQQKKGLMQRLLTGQVRVQVDE